MHQFRKNVTNVIYLAKRKALEIKDLCTAMLNKETVVIREFAKLIGKLVTTEPGVKYAPLFYKCLELDKDAALKLSGVILMQQCPFQRLQNIVCYG